MSRADRIAVWVKEGVNRMTPGFTLSGIILGVAEWEIITNNPQPCNPPDLSPDRTTFCGLPVIRTQDNTRVSICIDIPV